MPVVHIQSGSDERLRDYLGVRDPAALRQRGLLIAEGRLVVRRLIEAGRLDLRSLLLNAAAAANLADLVEQVSPHADVFVATPDVITAAAGFNLHRGCLAVAERPRQPPLDPLLAAASTIVALERVVDADNVGSVFRCAEGFGVDAVLLSPGCCDPLYRKAIRTSSGATLMIPFGTGEPWLDAIDRCKALGFVVVATTPRADAKDIGAFTATAEARGRVAVLLGTEGQGLTDEVLARADVRVRIPMSGTLDSLNIAVAAGIVLQRLHEVRRS